MIISSVISDITQIVNRKHSDLQNLGSDDHTQYVPVNGSRPAKNLASGNDADKPANPNVGDVYLATDTDKFYKCFSTGSWSGVAVASALASGLDADKPVNPAVGDVYLATDTNILYRCFVSGVWNKIRPFSYKASDDLLISSDAEKSTSSTGYTKLKEITVPSSGIYRISFDLKSNNEYHYASGQIYKNGSAFGTEQSTESTDFISYTEDLRFSCNDLIQLYVKTDGSAYEAIVRNFRIYGTPTSEFEVLLN